MEVPSSHAAQQGTLGVECEEALKSALREPQVELVLSRLRATHQLSIEATRCDPTIHLRGYFEVPPGDRVTLCCNFLKTRQALTSTLSHELVHAHDHLINRMELRDSSDLACSEIRAASLVDCADAWWFLKRMCVRNRAIASVAVNFPLKEATESVDERMPECYIQDHTADWSCPRA